MKPDEIENFFENLDELKTRQSGPLETLQNQKSKTSGKEDARKALHRKVISIRTMVKSANGFTAMHKAFGVGAQMDSLSDTIAGGKMIISAYGENTEWAKNEAGIIEADIARIGSYIDQLNNAAGNKNESVYTRKSSTMSLKVLQRKVEDFVTKVSAAGYNEFIDDDAVVAERFEKLMPVNHHSSGNGEKKEIGK